MLIAAKSLTEISTLKKQLQSGFEVKDLGNAKRILGMDMIRNRADGTLFLTQKDYMEKVLKRFQMQSSKPVSIPLAQ